MNIQPSFDRIIIKVDVEEDQLTTKTGLILTTPEAGNKPVEATVVAVGPGRYNEQHDKVNPVSVKVGDRILMPQFGGIPIEVDGEEYQLFGEVEVLGKIGE